jgi:hypothetical protein
MVAPSTSHHAIIILLGISDEIFGRQVRQKEGIAEFRNHNILVGCCFDHTALSCGP